MRPVEFMCVAADDDDLDEPQTVPRGRQISGVVIAGMGAGAGDAPPSAPGAATAHEAAATPMAPSSADPASDSGIYPIFEDGGAALHWMTHRRAVQLATDAIGDSPDEPLLYLARAAAKFDLGAPREALEDCSRALGIRPDCVEAYLARASIHFDMEAYEDCERDCSRALRIDPTCVEAYERRAAARGAAGKHALAIADYDEAIFMRPGASSLFKDRGEMKSRLGDLAGALCDLNVATAMSPHDDDTLFKRYLVKVLLADNLVGPDAWGKAAQKALAMLAARSAPKDDDGRIA